MNFRFISLLVCITLYGCTYHNYRCTFTHSVNGIDLCVDHGIDIHNPDMVLDIIDIVESNASTYYNVTGLQKTLAEHQLFIILTDRTIVGDCTTITHHESVETIQVCETNYGGFNNQGNFIVVKYQPCLGATHLAHELLHSIQRYYIGESGNDHSTAMMFTKPWEAALPNETAHQKLWRQNQARLTIEYRSEKMVAALCH